MKKALERFWLIFAPSSWALFIIATFGYLPRTSTCIVIIIIGFVFYVLKLYYINNLSIFELNYRTIIFDLAIYFYFVIIGIVVWVNVPGMLNYIGPEYFTALFPNNNVLYASAVRAILVGSGLCLIHFIYSGINHPYRSLRFTNKVSIVEIMLITIALCWACINVNFTGMLISLIIINTAPDNVRLFVVKYAKEKFNRDIYLWQTNINNNPDYSVHITTRRGYLINAIFLIFAPFVFVLIIHMWLVICSFLVIAVFGSPYHSQR